MYERVGKSVISVCKMRAYKGLQKDFVAGEKVEKIFWFCDLSMLKRQGLYSSLRDEKLKLVYEMGTYHLPMKGILKGYTPFSVKNGIRNGKCLYPPPLPPSLNAVK